jgi:hypothetical protein
MAQVNLFGPVDSALGASLVEGVLVIEVVLLVLVLANFLTRRLADGRYRSQAEDDDATVSRWPVHELSNVVLFVGSLYYMTLSHHPGLILSTLVAGLFVTDFFEFEARAVEARRDLDLDRPKGAIFASVLVLLYAGYQTLFVFIEPLWTSVI